VTVDPWPRDRADDLVALCDAALPAERLVADELVACCYDDEGIVLGSAGGDAAVSLCTRTAGDDLVAYVKLLAVVPAARRQGLGRALLDAGAAWARDQGAETIALGASAPFYLWPGVDTSMTAMLGLVESAGFEFGRAALNMSAPTTFRTAPPDGVEVRRALDDDDARSAVELVRAQWPNWEAELCRGIDHGSCLVGRVDGDDAVAAFACHSVNRAGWVGPIGTDPARQHRGLAAALMSEVCRDLAAAGHAEAEIAWVGPIGFYSRVMGASVSRTFLTGWHRFR
jgi:GNAT superfamily N-acetyltransferase